MFQTKLVEETKTHILRSVAFPKIVVIMRKWGKVWYSQIGHNRAHALCLPGN